MSACGNRTGSPSSSLPRTARLAVDRFHSALVVALARRGARRQNLIEALEVGVGQLHVHRADILVEILDVLGAGDRNDVIALREHPGESELRGGAALLLGHRFDLADELDVLLEILALEARVVLAEVVFGK